MAVGYGMTENSCATFLTYPGSTEDVTCNSVGFPIPGVEAKVIDEDENTLERGQIGELVTKGFVLFKGKNCCLVIFWYSLSVTSSNDTFFSYKTIINYRHPSASNG